MNQHTEVPLAADARDNPLLEAWDTPFGVAPFGRLEPDHFRAAFAQGFAEQLAEIDAIAGAGEEATFANTIAALELSGRTLDRVAGVFFNLSGAHTSDALQAIEREVSPLFARHRNAINLNEGLFRRVASVHERADSLGLTDEERQVLERYHRAFVRSGGGLAPEAKTRLAAINERLAVLGTTFGQNLLADEKAYTLVLEREDELAGLSPTQIAEAAKAAEDRGLTDRHVITLSRSSIEPFLQASTRRDLREAAYHAFIARGESGGATDNRAIVAETVALRVERARLLGYETFAHYRLDDAMAKTPKAALDLLRQVWVPARDAALREQAALQRIATAEGADHDVAAWDWRFYAEKRRRAEFDFDDSEIKPYLKLDNIIEAAFYTAGHLFGLTFAERHDVPVYHPDVRVWEASDREGRHVGLFLGDYFARSSKRSGAWMNAFRSQERLAGDIPPVIVNVMNFSKPADGEAALLSLEDARTLFHEFGHGLHGLLSDVTYPLISGTSVPRDFVEFPSQLYEHWLEEPEILRHFAIHHETGEAIPTSLLDKALAARRFNQGFATVEYVASALVDLDFHLLTDAAGLDVMAFERASLERIGMPAGMTMRHRTPHFQHVFAGDGYSSAYYSYMWSEVLDADGFAAFEEAGDLFDPEAARRLHDYVYAAGGRRDPDEAYRLFRGRLPSPEALLRKRGLTDIAAEAAV